MSHPTLPGHAPALPPLPVGEARELPDDLGQALWQLHSMPALDVPPQPPHWPFPRLDAIQARNHQRCVAELQQIEHRRRQQAVRECIRSAQAALGEALL